MQGNCQFTNLPLTSVVPQPNTNVGTLYCIYLLSTQLKTFQSQLYLTTRPMLSHLYSQRETGFEYYTSLIVPEH